MAAHKSGWIWLVVLIAAVSIALNVIHWTGKAPAGGTTGELYTCPMHPQVVQDHPGDCPICGMKLVKKVTTPASDVQTDSLAGTVNLSPSQEVLAAIATEPVKERTFQQTLSIPGTIAPVEGNQAKVTTRAMGRIEKLYVDFTGASVRQGQPLYDLYSPDIAAAQREMFLARSASDSRLQENLLEASRQKLLSMGLGDEQINEIKQRGEAGDRITFTAPMSGVIMDKMAVAGDWVMPGMTLFEIVDLSEVWVEGVLYEKDVRSVHLGDEMEVTADAYPGETFHGKVGWLALMMDMMTRTVPFRITLPNPQGKLKPEMYVQVHLTSQSAFTAVSIPESAVLKTGKMTMVWVKVGPGKYRPRDVQLGDKVGHYYPILAGLSVGEEVVTQGSYLIDSDSQIRSMGGGMGNMPGMQHGGGAGEKPDSEPMPEMQMPESGKSGESSDIRSTQRPSPPTKQRK